MDLFAHPIHGEERGGSPNEKAVTTHRPSNQSFAVKTPAKFFIVLVTAPNLPAARQLARGALRERFAACANLLPKIESHYWWQGKLESGAEALILFKTTRPKLAPLEKFILAHHPYDTPEFVVLPIISGTKRYLAWLDASVSEPV